MSLARRNIKRALSKQDTRSFYLVANDIFFGLVFAKKQSYYYKLNRNLLTSPSFTLYDSQTKAIIDYSNSKNTDDLSYILSFYGNMTSGQTFAFSNATFINSNTTGNSDLSGVYTFKSLEQNKIIKTEIVSTIKIDTKTDFYQSKFFTKTPQISKNGNIGNEQQKNNIIKNTIPNGIYSFNRMGLQIGDYVEFSGTTNNEKKKFKVLDLFTDSDGFECIQVDTEVEDENLIGSAVLVNLYLSGEPKGAIDVSSKTYGSCLTLVGITASRCQPCQNESLCNERGLITGTTVQYFENTSCDEATNVNTISQNSINNLLSQNINGPTGQFVLLESTALKTYTRPKLNIINISLKIREGILVNAETLQNTLSINEGTTVKISLQDSSLKNYNFDFFEDPILVSTNLSNSSTIIKSGISGISGSFITIKLPSNKKVAYLKATNKQSLTFKIQVN